MTPTAVKPDPERLEIAKSLPLARGGHDAPTDSGPGEACLLEREAWIYGEKWGACPPCVSRVLWSFGQRLNDRLGDEDRQELRRFLGRLGGTAGDGQDEERRAIAAKWVINTGLPHWLELAGFTARADELRGMEVTEWNSELRDLLWTVRDEIRDKHPTPWLTFRGAVRAEVQKKLEEKGTPDADAAAAADAVAVAAADADAVAVAVSPSQRWDDIYNAVRNDEKVNAEIRKAIPFLDEHREAALDLFEQLIDPKAASAA